MPTDEPSRPPSPTVGMTQPPAPAPPRPVCPACGGPLVEIRAKLQCSRCRAICETCCEGGPG